MLPDIPNVVLEQDARRLKAILPLRLQWPWFLLFSVLVLVWVVGLVWGVIFTLRDVAFSGQRYAFAFTIMLLIWLYIWYRLGKIVWRQWQYYAATREVIFIDEQRLIIRRPVSILGITDAYDMKYVSPFYVSDKYRQPAFDYANQRIYFAGSLDEPAAAKLVETFNQLYFDGRIGNGS